MKKITAVVFALVLVLAVSAVFAAAGEPGRVKGAQRAPGARKAPNAQNPPQAGAQWWGKAPGQRPTAKGIVDSITPQTISVKDKQGVKAYTITDKTRISVRGKKATLNEVKVGDQVVVNFRLEQNNVPTALAIRVPKPGCAGQIASASNNMIVLHDKKTNADCKVIVNDKTKYRSRGYVGTFADLRVGYRATANGDLANGQMIADTIDFMPMMAKGTITAVDGNLVTLKAVRQINVQGQVSPSTFIIVSPRVAPDRKGKIEDVKVGTPANIGYHANQNGPVQLLWIDLLTGS